MSKSIKKIIALLLALSFLVSILAVSALAEEPEAYDAEPVAAEEAPPVGIPFSEFSGRLEVWDDVVLGEWNRVAHNAVTDGAGDDQLTLRATAGGDVLYTIVEGLYRDTRNIWFISIDGRDGGFTFHGRPNVHYLVANGFLYRPTANRADPGVPAMAARPVYMNEFFYGNAVRLGRVGMEYHTHWTGMRLRLDQLSDGDGNIPVPADISISWQGWDTGAISRTNVQRHLPAGGTTLTTVGQFVREAREGVLYPQEDFSLLLNPLMGGGPSAGVGAPGGGQVMGYVYVSWRDMINENHEIDLSQTRAYAWNAYPTAGAGRDQWGTRGALLDTIFTGYANRGQYISLRLHMDVPSGQQGNAVAADATDPFGNQVFPNSTLAGQLSAAQRLAYMNLWNRRVADVPTFVIHDMRWQSNTPYQADGSPANCPHNIPFEADRPFMVPQLDGYGNPVLDGYGNPVLVSDGLYERMRNPADPHYRFFQNFRDQQLYVAANPENPAGVSAPPTPAQRAGITDGFFRCAIPNPSRGTELDEFGVPIPLPDLRVCPAGCVPYRRPDFNAEGNFVGGGTTGRGLTQLRAGWSQDNSWGPEGVWYFSPNDISGWVGLGPRYEHHMLAKHHEDLVVAMAEAIGDPESPWRVVAQVQLGSLGHWGEWHNWPIEDKDTFPNSEFAYEIVRHYIDAFAGFDNVQLAMRYANWIATRYDMGIFHDQAAQNAHFTVWNSLAGQNLAADNWDANGWGRGNRTQGINLPTGAPNNTSFLHNNINANMRNVPAFTGLAGDSWYNSGSSPTMADIDEYANAARNPTFWMSGGWSGGEWGDNSSGSWHHNMPALTNVGGTWTPNEFGGDWDNLMINVMRTIYAFRWANTSNLLPRGPNNVTTAQPTTADATRLQKNNLAAHDNMGYRFVIEEIEVDGALARGETVNVDMVVNNRGVAPFYRTWPFEVSFIDADGNVVYRQVIEDVDITQWMPRHRAINNARPAPAGTREVVNAIGETHTVYYRTADQLRTLPIHPVDSPYFIPAHDGRNAVNFALTVPADLPEGELTIALAILDPVLRDNEPAIRFANIGTRPDGRLVLDALAVVELLDITALSIDDVAGVIDQEEQTITFTVSEDMIYNHPTFGDQLRGTITVLEAADDMVIFYVAGQDWPLSLGGLAGVATGDTVRVADGIVYTIIVVVVVPTVEFDGTNPNRLTDLLETSNVILTTRGNLGIFAQHSPFVIPEGRTLYIRTTLNVQRGDVELQIYGNLVVLPGGRVNNQGNGSTITVEDTGNLVVNGLVENVTGSRFFNEGNVTVGSEGRFTVRASVYYCWECCGDVYLYDGANVSIHRDATRRCPVVEPEPED
ncbi:MAG: DUF4832 domain-containing protein [Oscillospiraceae bacterium]|nr:DUF4832 domain-containing protein [Oscillospiraceae bacterium]